MFIKKFPTNALNFYPPKHALHLLQHTRGRYRKKT